MRKGSSVFVKQNVNFLQKVAEVGIKMLKSFFESLFIPVSAILYLNEEGRGRSAHGWSSHREFGSLSRIGVMPKIEQPLQRNLSILECKVTKSPSNLKGDCNTLVLLVSLND